MNETEALIRTKLHSDSPLLESIPQYLLDLGGKRMRPLLTLLVGRALGMTKPSEELIKVAAGIELIHMATLLHDDIIDKSPMRRHKDSALKKFGANATLLSGDFLLVRAFSLCAHLDRFIIDATEKACIELTEGEIEELPLYERLPTLEQALTISRKKTAALFRLAAESAAFLCLGKGDATKKFAQFGESLGIAFQILDDILDVTSSEDLLGKPSGQDLLERKPSVINILWLESGSPLAKRLLRAPEAEEKEFVSQALKELRRSSAVVEKARSLAVSYVNSATQALREGAGLAPESDSQALQDLEILMEYTLSRLE